MSITSTHIRIPITKPMFGEEEERAVVGVLRSGWIVQGPKVAEFESQVANYVGVQEAVATSSCTTALHLALVLLGVGPGDEVIVPSFTFIATANVVSYTGATPVFVDIHPLTYNLNPDAHRGRYNIAYEGGHAGASDWAGSRHGPHQRSRESTWAGHYRRRRTRTRSHIQGETRRRPRQRHLPQLSSAEGHHRWGGGDDSY